MAKNLPSRILYHIFAKIIFLKKKAIKYYWPKLILKTILFKLVLKIC